LRGGFYHGDIRQSTGGEYCCCEESVSKEQFSPYQEIAALPFIPFRVARCHRSTVYLKMVKANPMIRKPMNPPIR